MSPGKEAGKPLFQYPAGVYLRELVNKHRPSRGLLGRRQRKSESESLAGALALLRAWSFAPMNRL